MTLFARLLLAQAKNKSGAQAPDVIVCFSPAGCSSVASRYEGQDVGTTVASHVEAAGLKMSIDPNSGSSDHSESSNAAENSGAGGGSTGTTNGDIRQGTTESFTLIVHGPTEVQGDHITLPGLPDMSNLNTSKAVAHTCELIEGASNNVIIADVAYANGGDPKLVETLLKNPPLLQKIKAYGGWNTAGNTMGSVLAVAVAYWYSSVCRGEQAPALAGSTAAAPAAAGQTAASSPSSEEAPALTTPEMLSEAHKQCLFVRLIDDWAYQACVRKLLKGEPSTQVLASLIGPHIAQVNTALHMEPNVRMCFPWKRTFEIEISFEGN
jgi:hypothetical protein